MTYMMKEEKVNGSILRTQNFSPNMLVFLLVGLFFVVFFSVQVNSLCIASQVLETNTKQEAYCC